MKLSHRLRIWSPWWRALVLFIVLVVLLGTLQVWLKRFQPRMIHTLGPFTQQVEVLWLKQEIFTQLTSNESGFIYAMPSSTWDSLMAINNSNGTTIWKIELPIERGGGARGLLADQNSVFVTTSIVIDAYETTTGELKWSTRLGDGHVSIVSQLNSDGMRVYYGDKLIELDPETGKILTTLSKGATTWVSGNVILQTLPVNYLKAVNKQSGEILWTNHRLFHLDEGHVPLDIGNDSLLVGFVRGICALNFRSGEYRWCHSEVDLSKVAIDYQSGLGYGMREDLVLLTIDLQTGNVLGETRFLSSRPIDEQIGSVSAIAFSDGVVVISFSDSGQTFGLKINNLSKSSYP